MIYETLDVENEVGTTGQLLTKIVLSLLIWPFALLFAIGVAIGLAPIPVVGWMLAVFYLLDGVTAPLRMVNEALSSRLTRCPVCGIKLKLKVCEDASCPSCGTRLRWAAGRLLALVDPALRAALTARR